MDKHLPDLPGSTEEDLRKNSYHPFFKKTAKEVWAEAEIHHTSIEEHQPCDHLFFFVENGVECKRCHIGYEGIIALKDGKLSL